MMYPNRRTDMPRQEDVLLVGRYSTLWQKDGRGIPAVP